MLCISLWSITSNSGNSIQQQQFLLYVHCYWPNKESRPHYYHRPDAATFHFVSCSCSWNVFVLKVTVILIRFKFIFLFHVYGGWKVNLFCGANQPCCYFGSAYKNSDPVAPFSMKYIQNCSNSEMSIQRFELWPSWTYGGASQQILLNDFGIPRSRSNIRICNRMKRRQLFSSPLLIVAGP